MDEGCLAVSLLSDVLVGTLKSEPFQMLSGVPQVSHLGPRLFNLYTNDMSTAIKKNFLLFADEKRFC